MKAPEHPRIVVRSPYSGEEVGSVPGAGIAEVDAAVSAAKAVLRARPLAAWERAKILDRAAQLVGAHSEDLARTISLEAAKPIKSARIEVARAQETFLFSAAAARELTGETVPFDAIESGVGKLAFTIRVPIGVIGAISPFNFPVNLVAHKLGPAIAAGCPVVLKPASQTPLSAEKLVGLLHEAGLPSDYLHLVVGGGGTVGNALVDHPDVAMISFTGSPEVGWGIRARAPQKRVGLELGNNAPLIVHQDADLQLVASKAAVAAFSQAGQSCISTQRIYVHENVADDFVALLVEHTERLVVGPPLEESTDVSALISVSERDRVHSWIDEAVDQGATVATGGTIDDLGLLRPTVLIDVEPDMKVSCQEVFGPVVAVATYSTLREALDLANDSRYGLQAAIFTDDLPTALAAARALDYGGILINEVPTFRAEQQPYGGMRDSGNTREGPRYAVREMTESKLVVFAG